MGHGLNYHNVQAVAAIAETMTGSEREDVANALFEVERSLTAGSRRLEEVVRQLT